jgi:hypothetical protein
MTKFKSIFQIICLIVISYYLLGCASQMAQTPTGETIVDIASSLKKGDIRLTCDAACSGKWGSSRTRAKMLYDNKLWNDLSIEVAKIGYRNELTYYFLARSAEELGYYNAALIYYKFVFVSYKCLGALYDNCEGFVFPDVANDGIKRIEKITSSLKTESIAPKIKEEQIVIKQPVANVQNTNCKTDSDCGDGKFCWSVVGGGKECQIKNAVSIPVKANEPVFAEPKTSVPTTSVNNDISKLESTCSRIGFKKGTEQFGDCVLELKMRATKTK